MFCWLPKFGIGLISYASRAHIHLEFGSKVTLCLDLKSSYRLHIRQTVSKTRNFQQWVPKRGPHAALTIAPNLISNKRVKRCLHSCTHRVHIAALVWRPSWASKNRSVGERGDHRDLRTRWARMGSIFSRVSAHDHLYASRCVWKTGSL